MPKSQTSSAEAKNSNLSTTNYIWDTLRMSHADFYRATRYMGGASTTFRIGITGTQWNAIEHIDRGYVIEREYEGDNPYAVLGGAVIDFLRASSRATISNINIQYCRAKQERVPRKGSKTIKTDNSNDDVKR